MTKTAKVALCVFVPTIKYKRMFRWDSDRFGNQDIRVLRGHHSSLDARILR